MKLIKEMPFLYISVIFLSCFIHGFHSVAVDTTFLQVPLQGTDLQAFESQLKTTSTGRCFFECTSRLDKTPRCVAFHYNTPDGKCELFTRGSSVVTVSSLNVFMFQARGVFHTFYIGARKFSIYMSSSKNNYDGASQHCKGLGGYLIKFEFPEEFEGLRIMLAGLPAAVYFVGANDIAVEGQWVTEKDNLPMDTSVWTWADNSPDNWGGYEDCAVFHSDLITRIGDVSCGNSYYFICERDV